MSKYDKPCCDYCESDELIFRKTICAKCAEPWDVAELSHELDKLHIIIASLRVSIRAACGAPVEDRFMIRAEKEAKEIQV